MAAKYTDVISFKANIEPIFQNLSKQYGRFSNVMDYKEDHDNYSICFSYPARGATHGERVSIQLSSAQEDITTLHIVSESIQNEFDCGNNRTHVEMILREVGKTFEATAISSKTKRNQTSNKILGIVAAAILVIALVCVVSWIVKNSGGDNEWATCYECGGDGKVENVLGMEVKCPDCDGVGSIYIGD